MVKKSTSLHNAQKLLYFWHTKAIRLLAKVFLTLLHLEKGRVEVSEIALSQEVYYSSLLP